MISSSACKVLSPRGNDRPHRFVVAAEIRRQPRKAVGKTGRDFFSEVHARQAFAGETVSDVLAGVLKTEVDLAALPEETPPAVRRLLRRCLERDARNRLHDVADARFELSEGPRAAAGDLGARDAGPSRSRA